MNKKGIMIGETVEIILAILVVVGLLFIAVKLYSWFMVTSLDETSLQHFNDLTGNIKELKQDGKLETQIIFLEKNHELISFDKEDSEVKPEGCYMDSCLCLCLGGNLKDCGKESTKCIIGFEVDKFEGDKGRIQFKGQKIFILKVLKEEDKIIISENEIKPETKTNEFGAYNFNVDPKPDDKTLLKNFEELEHFIISAGTTFDVSPNLIKAVIAQESEASISFLKEKGGIGLSCEACGLMQVKGAAFKDAKDSYKELSSYTFDDIKDEKKLEAQIFAGTAYLKLKLNEFNNNEELALVAYNAGFDKAKSCEGNPIRGCKTLSTETQNYVPSVLTYKNAFALVP